MVGGLSAVTLISANPDDTTQDFGYTPEGQEEGDGLIGDLVWFDENGDGIKDANEEGIEGVVVELEDMMGNVIASTTTDENGNYFFGNLLVDADGEKYKVVIADENFDPNGVLEGLESTFEPDGDNDNEGDFVTLTTNDPIDLDQDFGYTGDDTQGVGSIGDLVWEDSNADGIKDANEEGLEGVTIDLYRDLNGNGKLDPSEPIFASTTTDMNGAYLFDNLPLDDYIVDVTDEDGVLAGYFHSVSPNQDANTNSGNDPMDNSKEDAYPVSIGSSIMDNLNVDFGYYKDGASVGNLVWEDMDGDGIQDPGDTGITGVEVTLEITYPDGTLVTVKTTTDENGFYEFPNLLLDEDYNGDGANQPKHVISIETVGQDGVGEPLAELVPTLKDRGTDEKVDSDDINGVMAMPIQGNNNTDANANPALEDEVASYDFGFAEGLVGIGGTVFDDRGAGGGKVNDGAQNGTEPGIGGVTVILLDDMGNQVDMTTTNPDGTYLFTGLPEGDYQVFIPASNFDDTNALDGLPFSSVPTSTLDDNRDNDDNGQQSVSEGDVISPIINLAIGIEPSGSDEFRSPNQDGSENSQQDKNTNTTIDFGFQNIILPVDLLGFKAEARKDRIDLIWATASELNNSHFELERSEDGKVFKQITRVEGQGTTLEQTDYDFEDREVVPNVLYYYRLKQVDFDGTFEYSDIVNAQINGENAGGIELYPNPVGLGNMLNVNTFTNNLSVELFILDAQGKLIRTVKRDFTTVGWSTISIDVSDLASGTYFIADENGTIEEFVKAE